MRVASMEIGPGEGHAAGRALLARLYRECTGGEMPPILLSERGKPFFEKEEGSAQLYFSISHTKAHVFCVLSERPVGIDAEEVDRNIDLRLAEKILSEKEKAQFARAEDKKAALLRFWVLKEAYAKLTGQGLTGYPNKTDFDYEDPRVLIRDHCYIAILEDR